MKNINRPDVACLDRDKTVFEEVSEPKSGTHWDCWDGNIFIHSEK